MTEVRDGIESPLIDSTSITKGKHPVFVVIQQGIVAKVYSDHDIEVIVVDTDVGDALKLADITRADVGTISELKLNILYSELNHLV